MKVIYDTAFADPWVKVAQKLKQEHGYEPVYWNGSYDSRKIVPYAFPHMIYHSNSDACKGVFPKEIVDRFAGSYIDIDFLKDNAASELQAIKMLDKMDPDRYSFNFMERQRHFRNYLKYWTACITLLKPDLVISGNVPHQVFSYALYLLCKKYDIKHVIFFGSAFLGRIIPLTEVSSIGDLLDEEYAEIMKSDSEIESLKRNLPDEILGEYEKVKLGYTFAEPEYMKKQVVDHRQNSGFFPLSKKFILDMYRFKDLYFGRNGYLKNGIPLHYKQQSKSIENSKSTILNYALMKLKANSYRNKLKKYYNSLVTAPDLNVPYVMVNLHYQPEMSSSPTGDIFVDQRLCIEVLAKHLPGDYLIYVKEHPSQFYSHNEGHTSRIPEFYNDLLSYPQVRLLPLDIDPFLLFKNSRAVATVSGTSGWEAMVLGKPVIIFGLSWYERYSGVLKIVDEYTASKIAQFIENFKFDERNLLAYLNAFSKKSVKAYTNPAWKEKMKQDEAECASNLASSVVQMVSK